MQIHRVAMGLLFLNSAAIWAQDIMISKGVSVGPGQSTSLSVTLVNPASRVIYVSLTSSDPSIATVNVPTILFLTGATTPTAVPQVTGVNFGSATISASAFGLAPASQTVQVNASLSFGQSSQTVAQGASPILFLTLSSAAPTAQTITLTSDNPSIVSVPPSITIPANSVFAHFTANAIGGGTTVIHATGGPNVLPATVSITVQVPGAIALMPINLNLGQSAPLSVSLGVPAPPGGLTVNLSSSDSSRVSIAPTSVVVAAGASAPTVQPQVTGVNIGAATITASGSGYTPGTAVIPVTATLKFSPQNLTIAAGSTQIVMLGLSSAAPPGGFLATLSSDNPAVADLQKTVGFFPDGSSVASNAIVITGVGPGTTVIHASAPPFIPDTTMNVTVVQPGSITLPTNLSISVMQSAPFPVQLGSPAPPGGTTVTLSSNDLSKVIVSPGTVVFSAGTTTPALQPQVTGVSVGSATISASAAGFTTASSLVTVSGAAPTTVTATGGTPQSAVINTQFPSAFSAKVTDANNNPVAGIPVSFRAPLTGPSGLFPGGQTTVTVPTNAAGIATSPAFTANGIIGTYTVSAIASGVPNPAVFNLTNTLVTMGPIMLPSGVTLAPNQSMPFPITLGVPAPAGGITITLASSDSSKITITPSIFIAAGATAPATQPLINGITFGSVMITASAPGFASSTQTVQVTGTITISPQNLMITGTATQNLTLTLSVPAPAAGFTVGVASSNTGIATVPTNVTFAANSTSTVVPVTGVSAGSATITVSSGTPSVPNATATVTVKPASDIILPSGVTVAPGQSMQFPVRLNSPAPRTIFVTLGSNDTSKVTINPNNIIFLEGATTPTVQPQISGVNFGSAAITASAFGFTGSSETVQVTAALSFNVSVLTLSKGSSQMLFLNLSAVTPSTQVLTLTSDDPTVASVPQQATIAANSNFATVLVTGVGVGSTMIRATGGSGISSASFSANVVAPATILLQDVSLDIGQSRPFPISLGAPAGPGGVTVTFSSSNSTLVGISPNSVFIPAGSTAPSVQAQVTGNNIGSATITAAATGYTTATKVVPVGAILTFSPQNLTVVAGSTQIIFLRLSTAAPPDGFFATLSSDNPSVADLQHTVGFFPDGSSFANNAVVINGISPGTTVIHASAPPFIPDTTATITVVGSASAVPASQ